MHSPKPVISRRAILASLGTALTGASLTGIAQAKPAALSVDDIVARNISARGGAAAWHSVKALSMSGLLDAGRTSSGERKLIEESRATPGRPRKRLHPEVTAAETKAETAIRLPYLIEFRRPRQMRVELKVREATAVQVYDGQAGWKVRPYLGRSEVEAYSPHELRLSASQQELDGPLLDYAAKGTRIKLAGVEAVDGKDAYRLALTLKTGDEMDVWVDAQSFLDVRVSTRHAGGSREHTILTTMRDFRKIGAILLPFQLEDRVAGSGIVQRIDIEQVSVNPVLADSRFTKPA